MLVSVRKMDTSNSSVHPQPSAWLGTKRKRLCPQLPSGSKYVTDGSQGKENVSKRVRKGLVIESTYPL